MQSDWCKLVMRLSTVNQIDLIQHSIAKTAGLNLFTIPITPFVQYALQD